MVAFYTVVQYVPDPLADERINIGILTYGDGHVRSHFLQNWARVKQFGETDTKSLQRFAREIGSLATSNQLSLVALGQSLTEDNLRHMMRNWHNGLQFTPQRVSTLSPDALMNQIQKLVLREPGQRQRKRKEYRDDAAAVTLVRQAVRTVLTELVGSDAKKYLRRSATVEGRLFPHKFAVAFGNGVLCGAADGLSFESPTTDDRQRDIDALLTAVSDVREKWPKLPLATVIFPPKSRTRVYNNTVTALERHDVTLFGNQDEAQRWAKEAAAPLLTA